MRLLEREHPLSALRERARRAAEGRGSVVLVAGEAGIGKTALLRAFADTTRLPVLSGLRDSLRTPRPLGPLRDVAAELGPAVTAALRDAAAQHEIFAAVLECLATRPRALVVEDLHWADEATLDLVRFLARRIAALPLLLVLSYRDALGPGHPLRAVLGDLVGAPDARRLQLAPLSRAAIGTLVGALDAPGLDPGDVHTRTAGNPFFVSQILEQPDAPLPESVRDAAMIAALEGIGGDPSVLAHHAAAAADGPRILRYAPAAAAEAARSGAHREAVAFYELALRATDGADAARRAALLEALATELYLTDRLDAAIAARTRALELRRGLGDVVAVGDGHRALALFAWYAADRATAERQDAAAVDLLIGAGQPAVLGHALANRAYLAACRGDLAQGRRAGTDAQRIADELGDVALHGEASVGMALVRLYEGDPVARSGLFAVRDTGLALGLDELCTVPMSHLGNHEVEQGQLAAAEEVLADALRFTEERDIPICHMWQRGVQARLRLLQGRWAEAEHDALAVLASGDIPLGRLWSHLVLGLLAARRDAPVENPHLDELWRLATQLDLPGVLAPAAAALAEQAWITRRPDERLAAPGVPAPGEVVNLSGEHLHRWRCRLAAAGVQDLGPVPAPSATEPVEPYERALALWDDGSPDALLTALPLLDDLGARAVAARFRGRLRELGVAGVPRGRTPTTRANPAGLTERQLAVLALLAEGLSNADIAGRLVISRKTADHHVSAILAKLDARSRGEAVAAARRLGLQ